MQPISELNAAPALVTNQETFRRGLQIFLIILAFCWWVMPVCAQDEYLLGPEDEISIQVWDHEDLSRMLRVGLDGKISYPFVGEFKVQGLTVLQLQKELEKRLGDGYVVDPHVTIKVADYKSHKFFVMGSVTKPGMYPLTRPITLVEALSMAGGLPSEKGGQQPTADTALIIRAGNSKRTDQPQMPDKVDSNRQVKVSLREALAGDPRHNVVIKNGDTIFVPMLFFYLAGEVKKPGRYTYESGMTVRSAVITGGGFTDKASHRRIRIIRMEGNTKKETKVSEDDPIRPGDTIVVPESWF
jgi:polysaccharide export outer membrane protein